MCPVPETPNSNLIASPPTRRREAQQSYNYFQSSTPSPSSRDTEPSFKHLPPLLDPLSAGSFKGEPRRKCLHTTGSPRKRNAPAPERRSLLQLQEGKFQDKRNQSRHHRRQSCLCLASLLATPHALPPVLAPSADRRHRARAVSGHSTAASARQRDGPSQRPGRHLPTFSRPISELRASFGKSIQRGR